MSDQPAFPPPPPVPPPGPPGQPPPPPGPAFPSGPSGFGEEPYDEDAPLKRQWSVAMVLVALLVVVAMFGGAIAAFVVLLTASDSGTDGRDPSSSPSSPPPAATFELGPGGAPVANQDHWHSAYGLLICADGPEAYTIVFAPVAANPVEPPPIPQLSRLADIPPQALPA